MTSYCPVPGPVPASPANRNYKAGFTTAMMLKDLVLAQQAAAAVGVATPMGALAQSLQSLNAASGQAGLDFSSAINMLRGQSAAAGLS
jgi:3-hydroxyisobutyrate dehydrogenase